MTRTTPEQEHYRQAAVLAFTEQRPSFGNISESVLRAADAAVKADRARMAEVLRSRTMHQGDDLGDTLTERMVMMVQATFLDLASQIERGMLPDPMPGSNLRNDDDIAPGL